MVKAVSRRANLPTLRAIIARIPHRVARVFVMNLLAGESYTTQRVTLGWSAGEREVECPLSSTSPLLGGLHLEVVLVLHWLMYQYKYHVVIPMNLSSIYFMAHEMYCTECRFFSTTTKNFSRVTSRDQE